MALVRIHIIFHFDEEEEMQKWQKAKEKSHQYLKLQMLVMKATFVKTPKLAKQFNVP